MPTLSMIPKNTSSITSLIAIILPLSSSGGRQTAPALRVRCTRGRAQNRCPRYHLCSALPRGKRPHRVRPYPIAITGETRRSLLPVRCAAHGMYSIRAFHRLAPTGSSLEVRRKSTFSRSSRLRMETVYHGNGPLSSPFLYKFSPFVLTAFYFFSKKRKCGRRRRPAAWFQIRPSLE